MPVLDDGFTNLCIGTITRGRSVKLFQNYPNQFNPSTTIHWQSPVGSHQTIKVFDVLGNEIATLVDEFKPGGSYKVKFNLTSGIYFYLQKAGEFINIKKMMLMR
jgi:hypothetical protein